MELKKGIIVSIQGFSAHLTIELAKEAISGQAVALKTDKPLKLSTFDKIPVIGCSKIKVNDPEKEPYLTASLELIDKVAKWADYVSIDYRKLNKNLRKLSSYCRANKIKVIADIGTMEDYENIKENDYYYDYIATTFSVFHLRHYPDIILAAELKKTEKNIIAEGNFNTRHDVARAYKEGIEHICIGGAISGVYKLTKKFTSVKRGKK